jgi:hypothetical protein
LLAVFCVVQCAVFIHASSMKMKLMRRMAEGPPPPAQLSHDEETIT